MASDGWRTRGSIVKMIGEARDEMEGIKNALASRPCRATVSTQRTETDERIVEEIYLALSKALHLAVSLYFNGEDGGVLPTGRKGD